MALQDAAVLCVDPGLPAGANAGRPAAAQWQLQPVAADVQLDEAAVEAAAVLVAAFDGTSPVGNAGGSPACSQGQLEARTDCCTATGEWSSHNSPAPAADHAALSEDSDAVASAVLPLPPALAAKWLQSALPPTSTALQLLRPAAAAVLRAMLVSCLYPAALITPSAAYSLFASCCQMPHKQRKCAAGCFAAP